MSGSSRRPAPRRRSSRKPLTHAAGVRADGSGAVAPRRAGRWVRTLDRREKALIEATCARFIEEVLKPRFLPRIVPSAFNYKIDLGGRWRGKRYLFTARYRSGIPETLGREFDAPYTALLLNERHLGDLRFDLQWMRATGRWHTAEPALPLHEALELVETEELFWPP